MPILRASRFPLPLVVVAILASTAGTAAAAKFRPDDPVLVDHDDLPIAKPAERELSNLYDFLEHTFAYRPVDRSEPAHNINTLGEVPDSTWFTNRIGVRDLTIDELVAGARTAPGPDMTAPWTVIRAKSGGITPGFTIRDGRGDIYFVKFDPARYAGLSTSAGVVSGLFLHAIGYHVPANYIAHFDRSQLTIGPGARVREVTTGDKRPMLDSDLDAMLADVGRAPDGRIRCVASRLLSGEPIGPHKYWGTRSDDPNDIFRHEHRRELRGLRVFSAWLNHDDTRSLNSLAMFERARDNDRGHVVHYLIDFSSTLGSGSDEKRRIAPQHPRAGNEYILERGPTLRSLFTLGIWDRPWRAVAYPDYPEIGRFESSFFEPHAWRPEYPNPAFERMQDTDAFWATKILARFSDEMIRAAVAQGQYRDPDAAGYLADTLIVRRDKIVREYFRRLSPLDRFALEPAGVDVARLTWRHLGHELGLGSLDGYSAAWFTFDNDCSELTPLGEATRIERASVVVPRSEAAYLMVRIRGLSPDQPAWGKPVDVYLRLHAGPTIVGIERDGQP